MVVRQVVFHIEMGKKPLKLQATGIATAFARILAGADMASATFELGGLSES